MSAPLSPRRRFGTGAVAVGLAGLLLAGGCAGPRNTLNTATSKCFRSLPLARETVGPEGRLVGVRAVTATTLAKRLPQAERLGDQPLCVMAFRGPYAAGSVPLAEPAGPGAYAVVAVDSRGSTVLASFVVDDLPLRFRHRL
jgi:hypothetical protein